MHRIIIANESREQGAVLSGMLRTRYTVALFTDGKSALDHLQKEKATVLIADLLLANADGLELVKATRREGLADRVIVTGHSFSEYVLTLLEEQHVDYLVKKPYSVSALAERIDELCAAEEQGAKGEQDRNCAISGILLALGLRTKLDGFRYCREAIQLLAEQPGLPMTKRVYPEVGRVWGVGGQAVEKAIRSAVASAWRNGNWEVWSMYFSSASDGTPHRPTNTEFLTRIADAVSMTNAASGGKRA